ncbi:MerR family transcriptional regulator [Lentzea tibetensis]|uniref:MerR family transcriptional regulator n=1 Tax=Lentzea tibetensis TaxID=2591470 RepID=A0A563ESP2_9PSEU|nr:MerR family transcriptional regulator [Lentzea tibetensis]TWP50531.1 MerR family transcriptional regulator [Lentzea tibetensis]
MSERRRTVPTELAALALGVEKATIRKWASQGKLTRYGTPGRAEYDLDELMAIARRRSPPE